ncbi:DUF4105 domain-containing protein [Tenacibaculum sp. 190130A14a]|uniref:DUF4105 domain-containing protein n=1 Tax=Tenacibaculum polynesiense TaxID=3137857 RepID=A0ABM9PBI6_9FLAO
MSKIYISLFISLFTIQLVVGQSNFTLSNLSQISIITSGPGDQLYEKFGHTAIRVKDPILSLDLIYNYGMFDFNDANFYVNFTKGYMKYKLARYPFYIALKDNQKHQRWVKEQILNLNTEERNALFSFLENNALPENAGYFYDPFFDNCATKPRDILKEILGKKFLFSESFVESPNSLRQLMNIEIHPNTWASLGINIALGSKLDKTATPSEYLYLPDYVYTSIAQSAIKTSEGEKPLVLKENILLDFDEITPQSDSISPLLILSLLFIITVLITRKDLQNNKRTTWFDATLFFLTGLTGCLIVFLWFFTNHSTAPNNFNFLWAFAPNLFLFFIIKKGTPPKWTQKYMVVLLCLLAIIPVVWILGVQLFTYPMIPLFLLLGIRYWFLYKKLSIANS